MPIFVVRNEGPHVQYVLRLYCAPRVGVLQTYKAGINNINNSYICIITSKIAIKVTYFKFSTIIIGYIQTLVTNLKFSWFRSLATSTVADDTAVAPFIGLLYTGDG